MSSLYDRIIEQTKRLNMTGKELGQQLGLKKTPLTDWKNQKSCPTLEQVVMMCEIFAVSADYLIFGKSLMLSSDENEFLENFRKLDSRGHHRVHTVIYEEIDRMEQAEKSKVNVG